MGRIPRPRPMNEVATLLCAEPDDRLPLLVIDGNNLIARHAHARNDVTKTDGTPIGGIFGAVEEVADVLRRIPVRGVVFVQDRGVPSFRYQLADESKAIYPKAKGYKESRQAAKKTDPISRSIRDQVDASLPFWEALGIPVAYAVGYEADDVIAAIVQHVPGVHAIFSTDKDMRQLTSRSVKIYDPTRKEIVQYAKGRDAIDPKLYLTQRAMEGDTSDNIVGVPGIGPAKAALILAEAGMHGRDPDSFIDYLKGFVKHSLSEESLCAIGSVVLKYEKLFRNSYAIMDLFQTAGEAWRLFSGIMPRFDPKAFLSLSRDYGFRRFIMESDLLTRTYRNVRMGEKL